MKPSAPKTAFAMVDSLIEVGKRRFCRNRIQERRRGLSLDLDSELGLGLGSSILVVDGWM